MAYRFDNYDNSLVIDGFENGIANDPYKGISDMRNVNLVSVPGEASVGFATSKISSPYIASTVVTGLASSVLTFAGGASGLEDGMAIQFTSVGGLTGVAINTTYWVTLCTGNPTTTCKLHSDFLQTSLVAIGGAATGSPTFVSYNVGNIGGAFNSSIQFTYTSSTYGYYFMIDGLGQTWTNARTTINGYWKFTGVSGTAETNSSGGIGYLEASDGSGYIFSLLGGSIDYLPLSTFSWTWGWNPATGTIHQANYLNITSHRALTAPDSRFYYCNGIYIDRFYQADPATPFVPTTPATYVFDRTALLPSTDNAQCLTFLGTNILIGGKNNVIYPWDRFSSNFTYPILVSESNIVAMVTVNTNTYIFAGNRGRIYLTNGTNVSLFKKIPDHISGTVEPYFTWGGACANKNQLYFSLKGRKNDGTAIAQYGGIWAIDLANTALRLTNKLSYATYAGYATTLIANFGLDPGGAGLLIGWDDGTGLTHGIDTTTSTPYTGGQATIDSDLIPIGTYNKPKNFTQIEYRLSRPLVNGESIVIKTRLIFNTQDTGYTTTLTDSTVGNYSNTANINFSNAQWVQFQAVLTSTASNPSYVRLKEIRILGAQ